MKLATFIKEHKENIAQEWVAYAHENIGVTQRMKPDAVRDHIIEMLDRIAEDIDTPQTDKQQKEKSHGLKPPVLLHDMAAKEHGAQRVEAGFDIVELSSEFRALRASVLRLWEDKRDGTIDKERFEEMIRFNEAIDEAWMHSMARFHTKVDESKNWFIGILGHDLRNPLTTISGVQQILAESSLLSHTEKHLLQSSESSVKRMQELINNLLELTKLRLGTGMSIDRVTTDLTSQSEQIIQEFRIIYPEAQLRLNSPGAVVGEWDRIRINQVLTNLLGNALRHGSPEGHVTITISAEDENAFLSVHNEGTPIPKSLQKQIFTGRYIQKSENTHSADRHGLGLYIVKEIVDGHNGSIDIESTHKNGTTFTITLPRRA